MFVASVTGRPLGLFVKKGIFWQHLPKKLFVHLPKLRVFGFLCKLYQKTMASKRWPKVFSGFS